MNPVLQFSEIASLPNQSLLRSPSRPAWESRSITPSADGKGWPFATTTTSRSETHPWGKARMSMWRRRRKRLRTARPGREEVTMWSSAGGIFRRERVIQEMRRLPSGIWTIGARRLFGTGIYNMWALGGGWGWSLMISSCSSNGSWEGGR